MRSKLKSFITVACGGYAAFCGICFYTGNAKFYKNMLLPIVHKLDPEDAHHLAIHMLKKKLIPKSRFQDPPNLRTKLWSLEFHNPVGLAAGFDKHGEAVEGLEKVGFGFVEIGSVTPKPQDGNPKPRLFRLPQDKAVVNRYGFNSHGHEAVVERLKNSSESSLVLGVNLGKNKDSPQDSVDDFVAGVKAFAPVAHYLVINISSPNTEGLRNLQKKNELANLIDQVLQERNKLFHGDHKLPILVKIAPDLSEEDRKDIADVLMRPGKEKVDGIIISNSTISRPKTLQSPLKYETGGLTGLPLKDLSTQAIRSMYKHTNGLIQIIGVGGISTGADAYEKIRAGASLVQVYTSLVYEGFPVVTNIKKELSELLKNDGFTTVGEAVGVDYVQGSIEAM